MLTLYGLVIVLVEVLGLWYLRPKGVKEYALITIASILWPMLLVCVFSFVVTHIPPFIEEKMKERKK